MFSTQKRGKESPMDWEQEETGPSPAWALGQRRKNHDFRAASEPAHRHSFGPSSSGRGSTFPFDSAAAAPAPEVEMIDPSPERSLVLRSATVPPPSADISMDALDSPTTSSHFASTQAMEDLDGESDSKLPGSDDGETRPHRIPKIFARGSVGKTRRRRRDHSRSMDRKRHVRVETESESDAEDDSSSSMWPHSTTNAIHYFAPPVTRRELSHLDWPEILLGYTQFLFNASILAAFLYLLYSVASTIIQDVRDKVNESSFDAISEIQMCAEKFRLNRCGTEMAVPALDGACAAWARCMAKDPAIVGKARVAAETFAEIVNGFVDVISWKSMIFCLAVLAIIVRAANSTFNFFRSQSKEQREKREEEVRNQRLLHAQNRPYAYPSSIHLQTMNWPGQSSIPSTPAGKRLFTGRSHEEVEPSFALS